MFYIFLILFGGLGFLSGYAGNISFPNVFINSPYHITYLTGLFSLLAIFTITIIVAQNLLRESDTKFDSIIFSSPAPRLKYLFCRILGVAAVSIITFIPLMVCMYLGHLSSSLPEIKKGNYLFANYAWPLLTVAIPNLLICVALLCSIAWVTRNKLIIYTGGLFIYIIYVAGSIFSNSPLIAGSAPASAEETALFAKLDPFGIAAFFEQTRYWTAEQRNTQHISFTGNLLFSRLFWLSLSVLLLIFAYVRFSFRSTFIWSSKKAKKITQSVVYEKKYTPVKTAPQSKKHTNATFLSFLRIDLLSIVKGIPLKLIFIIWTGFLLIELFNAIDGDARTGGIYARSGLIVSTIMETLPFFAFITILFYSSEIIWRSKTAQFDLLENNTASSYTAVYLAKFSSIAIIPLLLILFSAVLGILFQLFTGFTDINARLYLLLFYFIGLPLILNTGLILVIQSVIKNKYLGLTAASVFILLFSSSIGRFIGIQHPLLRFANTFEFPHADMNGFGNYTIAFHWYMICWFFLTICILISGKFFWNNISRLGIKSKRIIFIAAILFLSSGGYIFYQTNIKYPYITRNDANNWRQEYENKFKGFVNMPMPSITKVQTKIDLYPADQSYEVIGQYQLINKTAFEIDSVLIYLDINSRLKMMELDNALLAADHSKFGHYLFRLNKSLLPGDSAEMKFRFYSGWSPFKGHQPFNSIIQNGTFIRISRYFPSIGYNPDNEISSLAERNKRGLPPQDELKKLESAPDTPYNYKFIKLDAVISTDEDQIAIGIGSLIKHWKKSGRSYFHYQTEKPVPFRFAVSSAKYQIKKSYHNNIPIEIYYDKRHAINVDVLMDDVKRTLQYCESNFGPYAYNSVRFAEVSAFADGFAATAYPGTIFMKENGGFYNNLNSGNRQDVINQLAGHELSHEWWGASQIVPEIKEGSWILTETLANYTEMMLYKRKYGEEAARNVVRQHMDMYLSQRSFAEEVPLYKTTYETSFLPYNKGMIVMYQLQQLIGEKAVNDALKLFFEKHSSPNPPPSSIDLINEILGVSPADTHPAIAELFQDIIIYDSKIEDVQCTVNSQNEFEVSFKASIHKYREDGFGRRTELAPGALVDIAIVTKAGLKMIKSFNPGKGNFTGLIKLKDEPVRIIIDPMLKTIDTFLDDNEMMIETKQIKK